MLSGALLDSEAQNRLLNEVRSAARLHNPNIVSLFDTGQEDQNSYIIMELVDGESLHDSHPESNEILANFAQQICAALDHAYQHGIIHRDLKPENILVSCNNEIKLTDFGLARSLALRMTKEGSIVSTVFYMAPELILGHSIDGRIDLYALGVILYELTAGCLPFLAEDAFAVISLHMHCICISS